MNMTTITQKVTSKEHEDAHVDLNRGEIIHRQRKDTNQTSSI